MNIFCSSQPRFFHTNKILFARKRDLYEVLGVPRNATTEEINRKFKEMAKKYHPDVNKSPDAKEKFAELNNAWQILRDKKKRELYDATGSQEAAEGVDPGSNPFYGQSAEEIFNQFFGPGGPFGGGFRAGGDPFGAFGGFGGFDFGFGDTSAVHKEPRQGPNVKKAQTISFREAILGTKKEIRVNKVKVCESCRGTGESSSSKPQKCTACNGKGRKTSRSGMFLIEQPCPTCGGTGRTSTPCSACSGKGYSRQWGSIEVTIPEGVETGTVLRLRRMGEPGINGGDPGDMLLEIHVTDDPVFKRKGNDLEIEVPIPFTQAILGGEKYVPTLTGEKVLVKIPPGTQHGDVSVVPGKGVKPKGSFRAGNQRVIWKIEIPRFVLFS